MRRGYLVSLDPWARSSVESGGIMSNVAAVKEKVQAYLTSQGRVSIDEDGDLSVDYGSTRLNVSVVPHPNGEVTVVQVWAPILFDVPLTPALYEYVALHASDHFFGSLGLLALDDGVHGFLMLRHTLLGDFLDKDELLYAAFGIVASADAMDDELMEKFGGTRLIDP
jgi:hypothetical protein